MKSLSIELSKHGTHLHTLGNHSFVTNEAYPLSGAHGASECTPAFNRDVVTFVIIDGILCYKVQPRVIFPH